MKHRSVAKNVVYSILTQFAAFISPLIISPYISRVFNADLIGDYSYCLANSSYFVLLECMGFSLYGTLKIAQIREDEEKRTCLFWEIFWLKSLMMAVCSLIYAAIFILNGEPEYRALYIIMLLNIIANGIDVTWMLNGLEEFKTVAIRTIIVRIINVLLILLLIKNENDLLVYAVIMQGSVLASYIFVLPMAFKNVKWINPIRLRVFKHIKPSMMYFVPGLVNTIFSSADKSVLGAFSKNSYEVGVYEQANKICQLCAACISSASNAILPRAAYMFSNDNENNTKEFVARTARIAIMFALPISCGIALISDEFIPWFFGPGYEKSSFLLKILCINVVSTSVANFLSQQCLIARGKQKYYNYAIIIGAALNLVLNIILVNRYMSVGVSIASAFSSLLILAIVLFRSTDIIAISTVSQISWKYAIGVVGMGITISLCEINGNNTIKLFSYIIVGCLTYILILLVLKDEGMKYILSRIRKEG